MTRPEEKRIRISRAAVERGWRDCTARKECVERFVDCINQRVDDRIVRFEGHSIACALYELLGELEMPIAWGRYPYYEIPARLDDNWREGYYTFGFELSYDVFSCQSEVMKLFDFAQSVCKFIEYENVHDVFFDLMALVRRWVKTILEESADTTPKVRKDRGG